MANRERLIGAALRAIARDGVSVPVLTIAQEAGLGVATFYRCFEDRSALFKELEHRAYKHLTGILEGIRARDESGLEAIHSYLVESLAIADQLVLPLHGAVPLLGSIETASRQLIHSQLEEFLAEARSTGGVRSDVNATDVIVCSALVTQKLHFGSSWEHAASRHIALFLAGLQGDGALPGPPIEQSDVEGSLSALKATLASAQVAGTTEVSIGIDRVGDEGEALAITRGESVGDGRGSFSP